MTGREIVERLPQYAVVIIDRDLGAGVERTIIEAPELLE